MRCLRSLDWQKGNPAERNRRMALSVWFSKLTGFTEGVRQAPGMVQRWGRDSTVKAERKWGMRNWKMALYGHEQCSQLSHLLDPLHSFLRERFCSHHFLLRALITRGLSAKGMNGKLCSKKGVYIFKSSVQSWEMPMQLKFYPLLCWFVFRNGIGIHRVLAKQHRS